MGVSTILNIWWRVVFLNNDFESADEDALTLNISDNLFQYNVQNKNLPSNLSYNLKITPGI